MTVRGDLGTAYEASSHEHYQGDGEVGQVGHGATSCGRYCIFLTLPPVDCGVKGPHRAERRREPSGGKPLDSLNAARRLAEGAGHSVELLIVTEVLCIKTCNFG